MAKLKYQLEWKMYSRNVIMGRKIIGKITNRLDT